MQGFLPMLRGRDRGANESETQGQNIIVLSVDVFHTTMLHYFYSFTSSVCMPAAYLHRSQSISVLHANRLIHMVGVLKCERSICEIDTQMVHTTTVSNLLSVLCTTLHGKQLCSAYVEH